MERAHKEFDTRFLHGHTTQVSRRVEESDAPEDSTCSLRASRMSGLVTCALPESMMGRRTS